MSASETFDFFLDLVVILPLLLAVRALLPQPLAFRLAASFCGLWLLYAYAPRFVPFVMAYWAIIFALQWVAQAADRAQNKWLSSGLLLLSILIPLTPMLLWKLFPAWFVVRATETTAKVLWTAFPMFGFADALVGLVVPLGLSFATFRALDLLLKINLGVLEPLSLDRVLYYGLFPPILALGPISEYEEVRYDKRRDRLPVPGDLAVGMFRIGFGAIKIFLIGQALERAAAYIWNGGAASWPLLWVALLLYGLFFYANFSGYSEIAIGAARVLGLKLKENFANPFLKTTPQAFWNAWHMSLTRWAQRYIFVPLGGMRAERQYIAIFATIMVIALWHGLELPMIVFGIYHASIILAHRYLEDRRRAAGLPPVQDTPWTKALKIFLVIFFVSFSIPMLLLDTDQALAFYGRLLFGLPL